MSHPPSNLPAVIRLRHARLVCATVFVVVAAACTGGGGSQAGEKSSIDPNILPPTFPPPVTAAPTTTAPPSSTATTQPPTPTYVVDPSGNDSAAGTDAAPWRTIQASVGKLKPGDTLLVRNGTYSESTGEADITIDGLNGTPQQWITIAAYPGQRPKLVGGEWKVIGLSNSSYVEFRGLELSGSATSDQRPTTGFEIRASHHIRVTGNYVHDGGGGGIAANQSNHLEFTNNVVAGMSKWNPYQTSGIATFESQNIGGGDENGYSIRIADNLVYGNENIVPPGKGQKITDGNCIIIDWHDRYGYQGTTLVENNVCYNNGGRGVHVFHSGNVVAVNNTLYHNVQSRDLSDDGELSAVNARNVTFRNNLVVPRDDRKEVNVASADAIAFTSNLYAKQGARSRGDGDVVVPDAGLVDPTQGRFAPRAGSPAIAAGTPDGAPAADIDGKPRHNRPAIGAYEAAG
jgi:parallel beta-helix repeat protein